MWKGHFTRLLYGQKQKPAGCVFVSAEYKTGTFLCSYLKSQTHNYTSLSMKWTVFNCMIISHHHCTICPGVFGAQQYPSGSLVSVFLINILVSWEHRDIFQPELMELWWAKAVSWGSPLDLFKCHSSHYNNLSSRPESVSGVKRSWLDFTLFKTS